MKRKVKMFGELKSWQLCLLGGPAMLGVTLIASLLARVWPLYLEAVNTKEALSWLGLVVSLYLGWIALAGIVFSAIGKRCGEVLYPTSLSVTP